MDLNELTERIARLEAAEKKRDPDTWPAAAVFPEILPWNDPEPLPWPADEGPGGDQPLDQAQ